MAARMATDASAAAPRASGEIAQQALNSRVGARADASDRRAPRRSPQRCRFAGEIRRRRELVEVATTPSEAR